VTVSAQTPINRSTANGVTTVFPYTFKILAEGDIEVSVDGVVKTLTTDYTVSGVGVDAGGNVTMLAAPANATTIVRRRQMAYTREVDYQDQGELPTDTLDDDQDAPILMIQQLQEGLDRAIKVSITSDVDPDALIDELLAASEEATDAAATATAAAGTATAAAAAAAASAAAITLPIPLASGGTGATTAAAARTALGAAASGANSDITSLTALSAGGLPNNSVLTADIADANITAAKLSGAQTGTAPVYGVRAWVVFDGSLSGTNAPTAGGNVTSVTRTGTGQYTVNLTTAMPSANYAVVGGGSERSSSGLGGYGPDGLPTTTSFTVTAVDGAGSFTNTFTRMRFAIVG